MKKSLVVLVFGVMFLVGGFSFVCGSGLLWNYESTGSSWIGETVSMGDSGSQVFTDYGGYMNHYVLFSSYDGHLSPVPIFDYNIDESNYQRKVASSKNSDVHAGIYSRTDAGDSWQTVVVKKFSSSSINPDWEFIFPGVTMDDKYFWDVFISDDGEKVIAWKFYVTGSYVKYYIFDSEDGSILKEGDISTMGKIYYHSISGDGSIAIFSSEMDVVVFDLMSGIELYTDYLVGSVSPVSLNYGGSRAIYKKNGEIKVLEKQGGNYVSVTTILEPFSYSLSLRSVALSKEGDRIVYALLDVTNTEGSIKAIDLENDNQETMRYDYDIPGIWINPVNHISM
ncbi:MAG: hypothetical protein ABIF88_01635, partial [archaeon]